jgi:hypothetical protein
VPLRRWGWLQDCPEWPEFIAWQNHLPWSDHVELAGGLRLLLREGPKHNCPELRDGLYALYAGRRSRTFWVIFGDAIPGRRRLLPLAWGTNPAKNLTAAIIADAANRLRLWREATEKLQGT